MYPVSQAYLTALAFPAKIRRLTGTISNPQMGFSYNFTEANVIRDSFKVSNRCSETDAKIGSVYMGELNAVFKGLDALDGLWQYATIQVSEGLLVGYDANNEPIWEDVPLGVFDIFEANHAEDGVHVTAYDRMHVLSQCVWMWERFTGYPYDFLTQISELSGIELAQTEAEIRQLVNGEMGLALYPENNIENFRDMLHWLAQTLGAFATINRQGKLELRAYKPKTHIDAYIGAGKRFRGGSICDFESYYSVANYENLVEESVIEVLGTGTGLTYQFGANPLLQYTYDVPAVFSDIAQYLFDTIHYTPFSVDMAACPAYDLGDNVELTDAKPGWSPVGCIMGYSYQFHGAYTIEGYGSNPALTNVMSATDKDLAQLKASGKSNEIQYYTFTNAKGIEVSSVYDDIIKIRFGTVKSALVVFQAEIKLWVATNSKAHLRVKYLFDRIEASYHPEETFEEGYHLLHLLYYYDASAGAISQFKALLNITGGTASIDVGDIQACVWGQGLMASNNWDGWLEAEDEQAVIEGFATTPAEVITYEDEVSVRAVAPIRLSFEDEVTLYNLSTTPTAIKPHEQLYVNKQRMSAMAWGDLLEYTWQDVEDNFLW